MAKVKKVTARKDYPTHGIKKGDEHYTWQLYKQPVRRSKEYPKRSQLTGSEFLGQVFDIADVELNNAQDPADFKQIADTLEGLASECEDKKSGMPDGLQEGEAGQKLEARSEACNSWAEAINSAADDFETASNEAEEDTDLTEDARKEKIDEARQACLEECQSAEPDWD